MAGPETAPGADAPAENLDEPQGSKSRGSKSQGSEPGPGWAHNPKGFVIHLDGKIIHPFCQETMRMNEAGEPIACGKKPRYVRTLWSGGTVFSCGRHLNMMEDFAKPVVAMGSRGAAVMKPILLDAPNYRWVPGAADPVEHPVHIEQLLQGIEEIASCWCGAKRRQNELGRTEWEGGKPIDEPWWNRK